MKENNNKQGYTNVEKRQSVERTTKTSTPFACLLGE